MYTSPTLVTSFSWITKNAYEFSIEIDYLINSTHCRLIIKNEIYWLEINMNKSLYICSNIIKLKHFLNDFCQIICNGDGPAWTSHLVATLLRLSKDGTWHHQHQWRTMRGMLLRLRKDGSRHHPHHRLKFSMGLLGRGLYASPSPGPSWNDTGDSPSPILWAAILD